MPSNIKDPNSGMESFRRFAAAKKARDRELKKQAEFDAQAKLEASNKIDDRETQFDKREAKLDKERAEIRAELQRLRTTVAELEAMLSQEATHAQVREMETRVKDHGIAIERILAARTAPEHLAASLPSASASVPAQTAASTPAPVQTDPHAQPVLDTSSDTSKDVRAPAQTGPEAQGQPLSDTSSDTVHDDPAPTAIEPRLQQFGTASRKRKFVEVDEESTSSRDDT